MKVTIRRRTASASSFQEKLHAIQDEMANDAVELYKQTVSTFDHKPNFTIVESFVDGKRRLNIYARESGNVNGKLTILAMYINLDKGFMRRVAMTHDFISKSQPGVIMARQGAGGVFKRKNGPVFIPPKPVEPRSFTHSIAEELRSKWKGKIRGRLIG